MAYQKILVAVDRSQQGELVFNKSLEIARKNQAQLTIFHCLPIDTRENPAIYSDLYGQNLGNYARAIQEHLDREKEQTRQWLTAYCDRAVRSGVQADWDWQFGNPGRRIQQIAKQWQPDLIVVGRRDRNNIQELMMGSVSNYIVHRASCSVLVVQGSESQQ
ncbi:MULTISPECIES: universal stress protein [Spirulina sp. CCY15215]|uniref:universal stress protein n=1 Tax=Spirulina sp. CCY15215 TaxID=2767591 RepID=UPI00194FCEEF|nr:universal stress protein [Spirulina major]